MCASGTNNFVVQEERRRLTGDKHLEYLHPRTSWRLAQKRNINPGDDGGWVGVGGDF